MVGRLYSKRNESYSNMLENGRIPANLVHDGSDEIIEWFRNNANTQTECGNPARYFYSTKILASERNEHLDIFETLPKNTHPTVKAFVLMQFLCKLITRSGGIIIDPFMGSGSTGKAAIHNGFKFIGIEKEPAYFDMAKARIEHAYKSADRQHKLL